ncbi:MAG: SLBB domain-containing protein [Candidatus Omnitrophota bacterium]|nr:SLBB domain-containing protein [Candidatus Omnitrophota bacterium]
MRRVFLIIYFISLSYVSYSQEEAILSEENILSYQIKPGDTLEISVYGEPDLNKTVKVSEEGKINYPFIGEVKIAGFTIKDASTKIEELFMEGYFVKPQVSVFVREYANFFVVGAVNKEGGYELKGNLALLDAIALAGGVKENADISKVKVIRKSNGTQKEYIIDLNAQGKDFFLAPLDRIIVEQFGKISVLGEVNRSDNYYLKKDATLFDAIAMAGGARTNANLSKIKVRRKEGEKTKEYILSLNEDSERFILKSGDTIFVKSYEKISVLGQVTRPGSYDFKPGVTAVDVIAMAGGFTEIANKNAVRVIRETKESKKKIFYVPAGDILKSGDKSKDVTLKEGDTVAVDESFF